MKREGASDEEKKKGRRRDKNVVVVGRGCSRVCKQEMRKNKCTHARREHVKEAEKQWEERGKTTAQV